MGEVRTHWIAPASDRTPLALSPWDEPLVGVYSGKCWFFDRPLDPEQVRAGLQTALVAIPTLTGRLTTRGAGRHQVEFQGRGARLDVVTPRRNPKPWLEPGLERRSVKRLMPSIIRRAVDRDEPLLHARVTNLPDGRSALGVVYSHAILDGGGSALLARAWTAGCAGDQVDEKVDRRAELVKALSPPSQRGPSLFTTPGHTKLIWQQARLGAGVALAQSTLLCFERSALSAQARTESERTGTRLSALDLLTGMVGSASAVPNARGEARSLSVVVDLRRRIEHPITQDYLGNLCLAPLETVGNVTDAGSWALASRRAITSADSSAAAQDLQDRTAHTGSIWPVSLDGLCAGGLMQDSWADPASYGVDFGAGRPNWLDLPKMTPAGLILILPDPKAEGRLFAAVSLSRSQSRRLHGAANAPTPVDRGHQLMERQTID